MVRRLGFEPRSLSTPDFKSVIKFAVRTLYQDTIYKSVWCVYQFRQRRIYLETWKVCWPSPYTLFNLHLYSTNGETRSELRGATSNFRPQSFDQVPCRNDCLQLSPAIQKCYLITVFIQAYVLCDWATRTTTSPYRPVTRSSTQTSLLVYHGLVQSPAKT